MITITTTTITHIFTICVIITSMCSMLIRQYHNNMYTVEGYIGETTLQKLKSEYCDDIYEDTIEFELEPISIEYEIK